MKTIMRNAALRLPPVKRLYDFSVRLERENQIRAAEIADLLAAIERHRLAAERQAAAAVTAPPASNEAHLLGELAAAINERDALELQLYVMRSDHHRATVRNQELSSALSAEQRKTLAAEKALAAEKEAAAEALAAEKEAAAEALAAEKMAAAEALAAEKALTAEKLLAAEKTLIAEKALAAEALAAERAHFAENALVVEKTVATERAAVGVKPSDISTLYAKLAGRMTLLSSEISRVQSDSIVGGGTALYLDLLEQALTGALNQDPSITPGAEGYDPDRRMIGWDWPKTAQSMIGLARMRNLRVLAERVVQDGIFGDMLEAGVWRGGACILMRGVLAAYGVTDRTVWVADSFAGLPDADPATYPADAGDEHSTVEALQVSSKEVRANFERYGLFDKQVMFLEGWFADTLPKAPVTRLAILRLDGDMYSSTIQTLDALYHKVSPGGYIIVDDYILPGCRKAVDDFRKNHGIRDEINDVDGAAIFWRKS